MGLYLPLFECKPKPTSISGISVNKMSGFSLNDQGFQPCVCLKDIQIHEITFYTDVGKLKLKNYIEGNIFFVFVE